MCRLSWTKPWLTALPSPRGQSKGAGRCGACAGRAQDGPGAADTDSPSVGVGGGQALLCRSHPCLSSSILPPHPLHLCPYMCPQSGPAFWMVPGSCGPAREKLHGGVLCSQPAHREPLCCLPLGLWAPPPGPPHGEQQASPPVDKCVHPYDAPVVPAAPRARL